MEPAKDRPIDGRKTTLSTISVGLMTAAAVVTSLRGLPLIAKEEMTMFAYLAFTVIFYLIPASLVSAELGGAFADKQGGLYAWVGQAFGVRWGFLAIWLQWIQNVVWYPVTLTFGAAALAYTIGRPALAENGAFVGVFCIVVYWLATLVVLQGVEVFAKIANWTFILGSVFPGIVLVAMLGYWIGTGHPIGWQHLSDPALSSGGHARFWPAITGFGTIAFLAGIILLFAGVEVQAVHVTEMKKPSREFPIAIGLGAVISLVIFVVGSIPIAAILPYQKISLQSGVFQTFDAVFAGLWHVGWLAQLMALFVGIGAISGVFAWLGSPCKGLLATADDGELPPVLQATNRHGMPTNILLVQGAVVTVISLLYFVIKDVSVVFFLISAMTIALYLIAYMLMYAAAITLRHTAPSLPRPFKIPGGTGGMWLTAGIGFLGVGFSFLVAFFPPSQLPVGSPVLYVAVVIVGTVLFCAIPLLIHAMRSKTWIPVAAGVKKPA
ncbi:MAG: amino acid permease [Rhodospirillales bacterium]|nr:amino acid permease [Rhodospirillales bacterium]